MKARLAAAERISSLATSAWGGANSRPQRIDGSRQPAPAAAPISPSAASAALASAALASAAASMAALVALAAAPCDASG